MSPLHVPSFGGGIVRLGSPNVQRTDELLVADSLDIGPRGQLVASSDVSDYYTLKDLQGAPAAWTQLHGLDVFMTQNAAMVAAGGEGKDAGAVLRYIFAFLERTGAAIPLAAGRVQVCGVGPVPNGRGVLMTMAPFFAGGGGAIACVNLGAREGSYPNSAPGLWIIYQTAAGAISFYQVKAQMGLGQGTGSQQLFFRGIVGYNNYIFGWGFDSSDLTNGDGPARVMFSNLGTGQVWGNDKNPAGGANRTYEDSDAVVLGDAGEIIRGALKWQGKLWFGTNQQLHFLAGFGRDSFLTDGSNPVAKSHNVVGPKAMIEGPDKLMYGVSDQGLWAFDGTTFEPHWRKLVDYAGHSTGFWDLIWTDPTAALGIPGRTNQDLVWTVVDWDREQVVVGIPYCNAAAGAGAGIDTVLLKFHTRTGGFTRQVLTGVAYSAASYERRLAQSRESRMLGTSKVGAVTLQRYGYQATPTTSPALPVALPAATFGPYVPFGPDGEGPLRRAYLTLAWESAAALPLVFNVTATADEATTETYKLTIGAAAPGAPVAGDVWLDTSQTDVNLGNATAGAVVTALNGYLMKTYRNGAWILIPGSGEAGTRARIPLPLTRRKAARATIAVVCTAAAGRFEIEDLGINPGGGKEAV